MSYLQGCGATITLPHGWCNYNFLSSYAYTYYMTPKYYSRKMSAYSHIKCVCECS
jgi:hypothetical protein